MTKTNEDCNPGSHDYEYQSIRDGDYEYKDILYCRKCGKVKEL